MPSFAPYSADSLSAFQTALTAARTPEACADAFLQSVAPYSIDTMACGDIIFGRPVRSVFYALAWPDPWRSFYAKAGIADRDPVVKALETRTKPFTWSELREDRLLSPVGTEALNLIAAHGWTNGLVVPIPQGERHIGLVSLVSRAPGFAPEVIDWLVALSLAYYLRARQLAKQHGFAQPPLGLTARELECLGAVARGGTDRDIAAALGLSRATVQEHMNNSRRKLQAANRAEAIAIAVALGVAGF